MCQPPLPATALHVPLDRLLHRTCFATREGAREALAAGRIQRADGTAVERNLRLSLAEASAISLLLDGAPLPAAPPSLTVALHKPRGVVTTCADEELAPSGKTYPGVRTLLSAPHRALAPIGRLDADSEGLLLLSNDGALSAAVCQSASCVKRYLVRIAPRRGCYAPSGAFEEVAETQLQVGVDIGLARPGRCERARRVTADEAAAAAGWCDELLDGDSSCLLAEISMATGAKREVRRILRAAGFETQRLVRLAVGPVELDLRPGEARVLGANELARLWESALPAASRPVFDDGAWVPPTEYLERLRARGKVCMSKCGCAKFFARCATRRRSRACASARTTARALGGGGSPRCAARSRATSSRSATTR